MKKNKLQQEVVIKLVNEELGFNVFENMNTRKRPYAEARQIAMYCLRKYTSLSLSSIGAIFNRDHATALHAEKKISGFLSFDKEIQMMLSRIHLKATIFMSSPTKYIEESMKTLTDVKEILLVVKDDVDSIDVLSDINQAILFLNDSYAKLNAKKHFLENENKQLYNFEQKNIEVGMV